MDTVPDPTISDPEEFDKQIQLRMGQANVHRWVPDLLLLLTDDDPLGTEDFATHHVPLESAPDAYAMFQEKRDGAVKSSSGRAQRPDPAGRPGAMSVWLPPM